MSFYRNSQQDVSCQTMTCIAAMLADDEIGAAVELWRQRKVEAGQCVCGRKDLDPVCCGFCLAGKLMFMELRHAGASRGVDFLEKARTVNRYIQKYSATAAAGGEFQLPQGA